ncbi:hypothetical protein I302_108446 [Kwoniella bestiolae CBS 10118]|uniref:Uncharacterized protein n=1 Tax=Kwoniella bestiolae CBS 10118 TaxID=1296100 RepID=A0A1B9FVP6_9TREE|nr:hypothetical protein I302_07180 [Kwoniella bestiolae CBS 10118]OCF22835.1 hypothetical protein I302_07180 [Kwoniella bestiolae CBS 10118]
MAFSSLADELAGAFDDPPLNDGDGVGLGQSLADEFGLDYGLEHGEAEEQGLNDPSTPPRNAHNLPKLRTPPNENGRRTAKSSYEPTNLDDTSPYRGIDEVELEYRQDHSFSPLNEQDSFAEDLERYEHIDNLPTSPIRNRVVASKSSSRSLRVNMKSSVKSLEPVQNDREEDIRESLIVLSEGVARGSKLLGSLRQLNHHHHHPITDKEDGGKEGGKNREDLEIRLQKHLNRMNEVERTRDEWNRDLGVWSREAGLGGLEGNVAVDSPDGKLSDLVEAEEGESLGWTGELALKADLPSPSPHDTQPSPKDNEAPQEQVLEPEHVDPHDLLLLEEDSLPSHPSDHSLLLPITPSISTTFHISHNPDPNTPRSLSVLIRKVQRDTDLLLIALRNLSDTIHTTTSFHTSISRLMKGIKSSLDSYRERDEVEAMAKRRIEEWEEERLKIGLTRGHGGTFKDRLDRECREFERVLEGYGERLMELQKGTTRMVSVA